MAHLDIPKIIFYAVSFIILLCAAFSFGLYSAAYKTGVYETLRSIKDSVDLVSREASTLTGTKPGHFLQPARYEGSGVTVNTFGDGNNDLILLSGFFDNGNELRLVRRDGTIINRWPVKFSEIFPDTSHIQKPPATDWNIDTHGALALPDGSVVFNFEYGGLVKLDRFGKVVWSLARVTHHSVERCDDGSFWVPGLRYITNPEDSFPPFKPPYAENTLINVSGDGEVLSEISVTELFYQNGLEAILTSTGHVFFAEKDWALLRISRENVHLNKIDVLESSIADAFPMLKAGDLALSMKYYNLVAVVDPESKKVKWSRTGPWIRQHDPEFTPGGTITVFNNNVYRNAFRSDRVDSSYASVPRVSNIIEVDPSSDGYQILYGEKKGQEMLSVIRGKHMHTPNGGLMITEFEGGRVFETGSDGSIVWEYINRYDSDEVAEITEARVYSADYFDVPEWKRF